MTAIDLFLMVSFIYGAQTASKEYAAKVQTWTLVAAAVLLVIKYARMLP